MSYDDTTLQGSGRTTRMLRDAVRLAEEGRAVYIMVDSARAIHNLDNMAIEGIPFAAYNRMHGLGIQIECPSTLDNFDWEEMRLRGAQPNCVVLIDHFTIESKFSRMLKMLHQYDAPSFTPAATWRVNGEEDPHAGHYDGERAQLTLGSYTDDELANAVFLHGCDRPSPEAMITGKAFSGIVFLTAAKDRIRWLSRKLEEALAKDRARGGKDGSSQATA